MGHTRVLPLGGLLAALACAGSAGNVSRDGGNVVGTVLGDYASAAPTPTALVGTWRLVSIVDSLPDGRTGSWMGERPQGIIVYDASGSMSVQIMNPARPRVEGDGATAPDSAVRAAYAGYYGYYGRFEVLPDSQLVVHHVEGSLRPAEVGQVYRRAYRLEGNRLILRATLARDAGRYHRWLTWERVR